MQDQGKPPQRGLTPEQAFAMAVALHRQGRLSEAERAYRAILQVAPHHFGCLNHLGMICGQQGRQQEAELTVEMFFALWWGTAHIPPALGCTF